MNTWILVYVLTVYSGTATGQIVFDGVKAFENCKAVAEQMKRMSTHRETACLEKWGLK